MSKPDRDPVLELLKKATADFDETMQQTTAHFDEMMQRATHAAQLFHNMRERLKKALFESSLLPDVEEK